MIAATSYAQRDFSQTEIKATHVAGTVYMLKGEGGNIGISVGSDGVLMVDDQFAPLQEKIQSAIDQLSESDVRFLCNTHWHGDHTGGNEAVAKAGTTIIAHENVRKRLEAGQFVPFFNKQIDPRPKDALPVITFDQSVTIHFNGERIDVLHFPAGHTDGDSIIFFRESNVVHMGDHFFNGIYPYIDLSSGGNVEGFINNVEEVLRQLPDDIKIIPGHGPLANKNDLNAYHAMLIEARGIVKKAIDDGHSLEQFQADGLPKSITEVWGGGFLNTNQWQEILYTSYSQ